MQFYAIEVCCIPVLSHPHLLIERFLARQISRNRLGLNDKAHELAKEDARKEREKAEKKKAGKKKSNNGGP
jgi:hypothetical protein